MNLNKELFITLFFTILVVAGCETMDDSSPTPTIKASNTAKTSLTNTINISPSDTPSPTMVLPTGTPILQMYYLMDNYLFPSEIDSRMAQVIQAALEERLGQKREYLYRGGKEFFSYALFQPLEETNGGIIKAYLQVQSRVFYVEHGEIKEGGGGSYPVAVIIQKKENGWLVEVQKPISGNQWGSSIRKIFPEEILPLIFDHSSAIKPIFETINNDIVQQAEEHFGLIYDAEKNSLQALMGNTPTPSVIILTVTPTPTTDISALEPYISARVFVYDEYISIGVNLYKERISSFQQGLLSSGWIVYLYKRQADQNYSIQDAIVFDDTAKQDGSGEFSVSIPLEEVHHKFGDTRGLVYQIVDKTGKIFFQDAIYIDSDLVKQYPDNPERDFPNTYREDLTEGLIIGNPNFFSSNISPVFIPNENLIIIKEPQGGFYSLAYSYNFALDEGISGSAELEDLSETIIVEVFPYSESASYTLENKTILSKEISGVSGILSAEFPHEWLDKKRDSDQKFYLRVSDENGNILREAYLYFIPYAQQ